MILLDHNQVVDLDYNRQTGQLIMRNVDTGQIVKADFSVMDLVELSKLMRDKGENVPTVIIDEEDLEETL